MAGGNKFGRLDAQRLGRADEIGFVIGEEIQRGGENARIVQPGPQRIGIEAGEVKVPLRAILILQRPADRGECERGGAGLRRGAIGRRSGRRILRDCGVLDERVGLIQRSHDDRQ